VFGGGLILYNVYIARGPAYMKLKYGKRGPSIFIAFLFVTPFALGIIVAYDGYALWESPVRTLLLWALMVTFWSTMLFVPMAVFSKYRESQIPELRVFPKVSVLIPAYNEEKVIETTIQSMLETDYPKKEIIVIDDGSTDKTLEIANRYKDQVKVLHKENGGKATALNHGLLYSSGEIVVSGFGFSTISTGFGFSTISTGFGLLRSSSIKS